MKCPTCQQDFKSYTAVSLHYRNKHGSSSDLFETMRQKYVAERLGGVVPTCECGCGKTTKYGGYEQGYSKFAPGHQARVNNNWGNNETARAKSLEKRRAEGLWSKDPWNRGKTKESDPEFARIVERAYNSPKEKARKSLKMKEQWEEQNIVPLTGSSHPQWKGGTSALQPLVRSHLYSRWTYPKLVASGFKCARCGSAADLEVHHDGERFASILHRAVETLGEPGDSFEKKALIAEWVASYHVDAQVSGAVLCEPCHEAAHNP